MKAEEFKALGLKEGDKVRLKIEGEFEVDEDGDVVISRAAEFVYLNARVVDDLGDALTIEKVAEPFKPGDVVRSKRTLADVYLLGERGYTALASFRLTGRYGPGGLGAVFPPDRYERVTAP